MKAFGLAILALVLLPAVALAGRGDDLVHVSVLANVSAVKPGDTFMLGVMLKIDPGWHVYWKNPGDSGLATKVTLDVPAGFTAGAVQYPIPTRQVLPGDIVNNIYENQVMLLVPIVVGKDVAVGQTMKISAQVKWLVCKEECVPGSGEAWVNVSTGDSVLAANGVVFDRWSAMVPKADADHVVISAADVKIGQKHAVIGFVWKSDVSEVEWFPSDFGDAILKNVKLQTEGAATTITFDVDAGASGSLPRTIDSVLVFVDSSGVRQGLEFPLSVDWGNVAAVSR